MDGPPDRPTPPPRDPGPPRPPRPESPPDNRKAPQQRPTAGVRTQPKVASAPEPKRVESGPWEAVQAEFRTLGPLPEKLAGAQPTFNHGTLTLKVPGGRPLAEARRAIRDPAVVRAVTRHYGDTVSVVVNALPGTGSENDRRKAIERTVLSDPDVQRIMASLGAELHQAKALTDGE